MNIRSGRRKHQILLEVLQNGEYLDDAAIALGRSRKLSLSTKKGTLTIPFYPISYDLEIGRVHRDGLSLNLSSNWNGFIISKGQHIEVGPSHGPEFNLKPGDMGCFSYNDLKLLIKIVPEAKVSQVPINKIYKGKWADLIFSSKMEVQAFAASMLLACLLIGTFIFGLSSRPDMRPHDRVDLSEDYNIAFVHPDHIRNLPEALQHHLDRSRLLEMAIGFYRSVTETFMGYRPTNEGLVFKNTIRLYDAVYEGYQSDIDAMVDHKRELVENIAEDQTKAIIAIPAIMGETLPGSVLRLRGKIAMLHDTFEKSLEVRRQTTKAFNSDVSYDFEEYRVKGLKAKSNSAISMIKPFTLMTNEERMYQEAQELSATAQYEQAKISKLRSPVISVSSANSEPIGLNENLTHISFLPQSNFSANRKIQSIAASAFGAKPKAPIKEPLIGQINPELIEKVINNNRFELQLCYELALRRDRNLAGQMEWSWRLDSRGKISELKLQKTNIGDRAMRRCVKQKIARWKFPRPRRGSVKVTYPFSFRPARG